MIGWGGEDVPGHPVPINTEGKACMHMQRDNEGIRLPKLLGLAVAGATLLAGMVVLPATQASAAEDSYGFSTEDNFKPGDLDATAQPKLTVTKYFSLVDGYAATGSANDVNNFKQDKDLVPAQGIRFNVFEVVPDGSATELSEIVATDESTWKIKPDTQKFVGETDGQGVINKWYAASADGSPNKASELQFPKGAGHYFVLKEDQKNSPAFAETNHQKLDITKYAASANSFFGLPYATNGTDSSSTRGYIYNLHLFPKNRRSAAFAKTVQGVTDATSGQPKASRFAKAGDKISYKLSQTIFNEAKATPKDGKLDTKELKGSFADLRIVDRMSSSLSANNDFTVKIDYKDNQNSNADKSLPLEQGTDYKLSTPTDNPDRLLKTQASPSMFPDKPGDVSYFQFDFFGGNTDTGSLIDKMKGLPATVLQLDITYTATATGKGDSTGTDGLANDAASDFTENTTANGDPTDPISEHTNVVNAVLVFGSIKSEKDSYAALPKTEYRLVDPNNQDKYLASDGQFYAPKATLPEGVVFYSATANKDGLVVFAGLPIFDTPANGTDTKAATNTVPQGIKWNVLETKTPSGWRSPGFPFKYVTYDNYANKTLDDLVQELGPHAAVQPDYSKLNFGKFDVPATSITKNPIKFNNENIKKYLEHYAVTDSDSPLALPLTGGRGILLLLVVGALLMGGALYARSRRNNAARA